MKRIEKLFLYGLGRVRLKINGVIRTFFFLIIWIFVSSIINGNFFNSMEINFLWLQSFVLFVYLYNSVNAIFSFEDIKKIFNILLCIFIFTGSIQFFTGTPFGAINQYFGELTNVKNPAFHLSSGVTIKRVQGTFPSSNTLSQWLILLLSFQFVVYKFQRTKLNLYLFIIGTIILILTFSRGSLAGFILSILVIHFFLKLFFKQNASNKYLNISLNFGGLIIIFLIAISLGLNYLLNIFRLDILADSFSRRWDYIYYSINLIKENIIFGMGLGQSTDYFSIMAFEPHMGATIHNIYLILLLELGIAGLLFFLWFLGSALNYLRRQLTITKDRWNEQFVIIKFSGFVSLIGILFVMLWYLITISHTFLPFLVSFLAICLGYKPETKGKIV